MIEFGSIVGPRHKVPLMMEFQINPETSPFLVSSTRSLMWVSKFRENLIRAAVRRNVPSLGHYFMEVVLSVAQLGMEAEWGNVHPLSRKGIEAAVAHLGDYDLEDVVLLVSEEGFDKDIAKAWRDKGEEETLLGKPYVRCDWLHPGYIVVVPQDRDNVGWVAWDAERLISVVHNAGRGIAIARRPALVRS